jgi:hypothetical protein
MYVRNVGKEPIQQKNPWIYLHGFSAYSYKSFNISTMKLDECNAALLKN